MDSERDGIRKSLSQLLSIHNILQHRLILLKILMRSMLTQIANPDINKFQVLSDSGTDDGMMMLTFNRKMKLD